MFSSGACVRTLLPLPGTISWRGNLPALKHYKIVKINYCLTSHPFCSYWWHIQWWTKQIISFEMKRVEETRTWRSARSPGQLVSRWPDDPGTWSYTLLVSWSLGLLDTWSLGLLEDESQSCRLLRVAAAATEPQSAAGAAKEAGGSAGLSDGSGLSLFLTGYIAVMSHSGSLQNSNWSESYCWGRLRLSTTELRMEQRQQLKKFFAD